MTDQPTPTPDASGTPAQVAASDTPANPNDISSLPDSWQKEIRELRAENAKRRKAETEAENARKAAEEMAMAEQGKYKELAEQRLAEIESLKARAAKADAYEQQAAETLRKRIAALPEHVRGAVPEYDDPLKTVAWLDANAAVLSLPTPPPTDAGVRGAVPATPAKAAHTQAASIAAQYGYKLNPDQIAAREKQMASARDTKQGE